MHYYKHNIGDYRRDTIHLSLLEHGVYRQLLDCYYLSESPLPAKTEEVFRRLSAITEDEQKTVERILKEFFCLTKGGWIHARCDREIEAYKAKASSAKANGAVGGRPRKQKTESVISRFPEKTETKANAVTHERINAVMGTAGIPPARPGLPRSKAPSKLTEKWNMPHAFKQWAADPPRSMAMNDIEKMASDFRFYWATKTGKAAFKDDWLAAWQRWVDKRLAKKKKEKFNPLAYVNKDMARTGEIHEGIEYTRI